MLCFIGPSFQEGSGSAATAANASGGESDTLAAGESFVKAISGSDRHLGSLARCTTWTREGRFDCQNSALHVIRVQSVRFS